MLKMRSREVSTQDYYCYGLSIDSICKHFLYLIGCVKMIAIVK